MTFKSFIFIICIVLLNVNTSYSITPMYYNCSSDGENFEIEIFDFSNMFGKIIRADGRVQYVEVNDRMGVVFISTDKTSYIEINDLSELSEDGEGIVRGRYYFDNTNQFIPVTCEADDYI